MKPNTTMIPESRPYIVVIDADFDSEWYLTPMSFPTHDAAMRHAAGIAKSWQDRRSAAPSISIKGPERVDSLSVDSLLFVGLLFSWFEDRNID